MLHRLVIDCLPFKKTIDLCESFYSIGRSSTNSLVIPLTKISRIHATIIRARGQSNSSYSFYILDGDIKGNKSSNGVYVNGERVVEHELKHGDTIYLADQKLAVFQVIKNDYSEDVLDWYNNLDRFSSPQRNTNREGWKSISMRENNQVKPINKRELVEAR